MRRERQCTEFCGSVRVFVLCMCVCVRAIALRTDCSHHDDVMCWADEMDETWDSRPQNLTHSRHALNPLSFCSLRPHVALQRLHELLNVVGLHVPNVCEQQRPVSVYLPGVTVQPVPFCVCDPAVLAQGREERSQVTPQEEVVHSSHRSGPLLLCRDIIRPHRRGRRRGRLDGPPEGPLATIPLPTEIDSNAHRLLCLFG
mmetsp:Transcript_40400/g.101078  ORF Transcript_40400/g.101078 Transcript_40400/m.101078 type:complete len:200 (+) Transcript_40400:1755-2354(+)